MKECIRIPYRWVGYKKIEVPITVNTLVYYKD
jgi:hypothetical protein